MSSFNLLSNQIQKFIWDTGWGNLRPIQEASIKYILETKDNYILSAATASGKTEAAFLPILSSCYPEGTQQNKGVKILYISPLIALINDQFHRVEDLCKYLQIKITKWHGEASISEKKKLILNPEGIVLITPESIEALFCNKPQEIQKLFSEIDFIVIDEIHSFLNTDRGVHLQSLLYRLQELNVKPIRFVGLSATLGDYELAKQFFGNSNNTKVLKDAKRNEIITCFKYFHQETADLSQKIIDDLYHETLNSKTLVFPNSRTRVEEISVRLKKKSSRNTNKNLYFSHHSSVEKELREEIENFAKTNVKDNFAIVCTSTLELGIDIGSIDKVIQVGQVTSINSLSQRLGRSGRKSQKSHLVVYNLDQWQLIHNIACYELLKDGFLEPGKKVNRYDILIQQILSILKQTSGIERQILIAKISKNWAFTGIKEAEIQNIIDHLIQLALVENLKKELILGVESQYLVTSKDFYAVFEAVAGFKVIYNNTKTIGEIDSIPLGRSSDYIGENIFLSAQIWKITHVDEKKRKCFVDKANDGKPPAFSGNSSSDTHLRIREKMLEIVIGDKNFGYIDNQSKIELRDLRKSFLNYRTIDYHNQRPAIEKHNNSILYPFAGSIVYRTIKATAEFLNQGNANTKNLLIFENNLQISVDLNKEKALEEWNIIKQNQVDLEKLAEFVLDGDASKNTFTKYSKYLPKSFQNKLFANLNFDNHYYDFVTNIKFI